MAATCKLMPKIPDETVMFKGDEDTYESLFDKLVSFCVGDAQPEPGRQTSARTCTRKERPNAMQVAALSKGGKSRSGKGKSVTSFVCNKTDHISRDCFPQQGQQRRQRKVRQNVKRCQG